MRGLRISLRVRDGAGLKRMKAIFRIMVYVRGRVRVRSRVKVKVGVRLRVTVGVRLRVTVGVRVRVRARGQGDLS